MTAAWLAVLVAGELELARGVEWRSSSDGSQVIHELDLDLGDPDVVIRVDLGWQHCMTVESIAEQADWVDGRPPVAAINFGFFAPWAPCLASSDLVSLVEQDGMVVDNWDGGPKAAIGRTIEGEWATNVVSYAAAWPEVDFALGARGLLIDDGRLLDPLTWRDDEWIPDVFALARHPRTAIAIDADADRARLVTVDGRRRGADGMTLAELQALLADPRHGSDFAVNLDGGGSTTMWIGGHGVVNEPSDGVPREVIGALLVYAAPATRE